MSIVMEIGGITATYTAGAWSSKDEQSDAVIDMLNVMMTEQPGPSGADPYPALTRAQDIARHLHGRITDEGKPPAFDPKVIY